MLSHPFLQLIRLPALFTSWTNVAASYALCAFFLGETFSINYQELILLSIASTLLYTSGLILNDIADFKKDKTNRPERPLPSGKISMQQAKRLATVFILAALSILFSIGIYSLIVGLLVLGFVFSYNYLSKHLFAIITYWMIF